MKTNKIVLFIIAALSLIYMSCACTKQEPKPAEALDQAKDREPVTTRDVVTPAPAPVAGMTDPPPPPPPYIPCKADMVEVKGTYCPGLKETCAEWMAPDDHYRCKRFAKSVCVGATVEKHFCVDRYEYPNKVGETPKVMVLWDEAQNLCKTEGKRLCYASEWTFACQGKDWKPYPYGNERDSAACRIDLGGKEPSWANAPAQGYGRTPAPLHGMACVNFSRPSGEYAKCVSDFGVHDLTGNADEWVASDDGIHPGDQSWLKGGWWGNLRNRCGTEATTKEHGKDYAGIQVSFRCCSDVSK